LDSYYLGRKLCGHVGYLVWRFVSRSAGGFPVDWEFSRQRRIYESVVEGLVLWVLGGSSPTVKEGSPCGS